MEKACFCRKVAGISSAHISFPYLSPLVKPDISESGMYKEGEEIFLTIYKLK